MEEVRQLVQEEGREARNLVAFHVAVDTPSRISRKPPRAGPPPRRAVPRVAPRLRSASAGRDKRSELRARYWALLFGDLQRAIGEIYNTVEAHENLNECQEVMLVLENYTRDFKALGEWFRLKWEYDNTAPPQRPQSLAWEIRKTDFVRPESRKTYSVKSSPSVSGKNSPCLSGHNTPSGKNSPNLTGKASPGSGKISPRISGHSNTTSPKANIEFFSSKIASKITAKPEPKSAKEISRLSDIKEKEVNHIAEDHDVQNDVTDKTEEKEDQIPKQTSVEVGKAKECPNTNPKLVVIKSPKRTVLPKNDASTTINDLSGLPTVTAKLDAIEHDLLAKKLTESAPMTTINDLSGQPTVTAKLDAIEHDLLAKKLTESAAIDENELNLIKDIASVVEVINSNASAETQDGKINTVEDRESTTTESPVKSEDNFGDISNESSCKSPENEDTPIHKEENVNPNKIKTEMESLSDDNTQLVSDSKQLVSDSKLKLTSDAINEPLNSPTKCEITKNSFDKEDSKETSQCELKDGKKDSKTVVDNPQARAAYSQAAAKPKPVTIKLEPKVQSRVMARSKTVVDIRPCSSQKTPIRNDPRNRSQSNKCSYPFNLTTGRTSLFDTPNKVQVTKKPPVNRFQSGAGDNNNKTTTKVDIHERKRPPRPTTLKINEKGQKKEQSNPSLDEIKDCDEYGSSDTIVTQTNFSRIESSESLKTLVPEDYVGNSIEVLNVDVSKNDDDGWLTVKSRRLSRESKKQSKSHWANRFHQPSATTSLPTLNMIESPKQEIKEIASSSQLDRAKSEQPQQVPHSNIPKQRETQLNEVPKRQKVPIQESKPPQVPKTQWTVIPQKIIETKKTQVPKIQEVSRPQVVSRPQEVSKSQEVSRPHEVSRTQEVSRSLEVPQEIPKPQEKSTTPIPQLSRSQELPKQRAVSKSKLEAKDKKELAMIRQKSDVTGLKTRTSRSRALKREKNRDSSRNNGCDLTKNRLHSSLESLTTGLARSQESTKEMFDFDKWKCDFKSTFKFLEEDDQLPNHNEILKAADPSEMSEIAEMTSQIEENERKMGWALDFQSDVDQKKLCEEEDMLNRQIRELQQVSDIDVDTETDDTETDAEILCEGTGTCNGQSSDNLTTSLEDQYETALAGMSWAERIDTLGALEALVARDPGRAQQLHAKLSQGIKRRGSLQDALRRLQAKQARAERQRIEYQTERARRIHQLLAKVEEVKVAKNQLIEEKRLRMERRLQKAAQNRDQHLKDIVRKAHDEEEKLREIAFIKQLEAENRRHEFLDLCRSHTSRLRSMRRDRLSKLEQKAAREAAVGARRQALEAARKLYVENMLEKRKERDARVEELKELKKQERDDAAREKAEGVKFRLSALAAAAELEADALRSRIRDKQDASQQRLESHLQAIREKATGPRQVTTSESQDQTSKEEKELQEEAERLEQERKEREKQKAIKKRARKVRQKLLATSSDKIMLDVAPIIDITGHHTRTSKLIHTIQQIVTPLLDTGTTTALPNGYEVQEVESKKNKKGKKNNADAAKENNNNNEEDRSKKKKKGGEKEKPKLINRGLVCSAVNDRNRVGGTERGKALLDIVHLERQLNELYRMIERFDRNKLDKTKFQKMQVVKAVGQFVAVAAEREDLASQITARSLMTAVMIFSRVISGCPFTSAYFIHTNASVNAVKLLSNFLEKDLQSDQRDMEVTRLLADCVSVALDSVICATRIFEDKRDMKVAQEEVDMLTNLRARVHTLISYLCLVGCITRAEKAGEARETVQTLLTLCADLCHPCEVDLGLERASAIQSLRCALGTGVCGSRAEFCMLFAQGAGLEHSGGFVRAARTAHLLRTLAELDHQIVQDAFGEGGWPLEFRAAVARLLSQHAPNDKEAPRKNVLNLSQQRLDQSLSETMVLDLIVLVGFVVVNNPQLQETICEGWSVIKTLCTLPANWLVSRHHSHMLLPTLVALSEHSSTAKAIASELNTGLLDEWMKSPDAQRVKLAHVIKQGRNKKGKK